MISWRRPLFVEVSR